VPPVAAAELDAVAAVPDGQFGAQGAAAGAEPVEAVVQPPGAAVRPPGAVEALALIPAAPDAVVAAAVQPGAAARLV
jgi:hypothetical protein